MTHIALHLQVWTKSATHSVTLLLSGGVMLLLAAGNGLSADLQVVLWIIGVVVIGVGGFLAKDFLAFKGKIPDLIDENRAEFANKIEAVEARLSAKAEFLANEARRDKAEVVALLAEHRMTMERMNVGLFGLDGQSGLMGEVKLNQKQRHDLNNTMLVIQGTLVEILKERKP